VNKPHKNLKVWQKAMDLVLKVYQETNSCPTSETYGLTSQTRRAAVSIPSNIAEGASRRTKKEFLQFLYIARGSLSELDTQFELAERLGYLSVGSRGTLNVEMTDIDKMISGLIRHQKKT
jgi:four helix bundle protein